MPTNQADSSQQTVDSQQNSSEASKLRHWTRLPVESSYEKTTLLLDGGEKLSGSIVDDSYGGIGVMLSDASGIQVGDELRAEFGGAPIRAIVRCVRPNPEGTSFVGLEWAPRRKTTKRD